jgi:putative FmdB family regulatory protein
MPIYEYRCNDCGSKYEVLHLTREVIDDVVCPECTSTQHHRLMSATNVSTSGMGKKSEPGMPPCASGCCGGSCDMA